MKFEYKIGCDPELFVVDDKGNFRSAHNLIPGSKHQPSPVLSGAIQPDGTAAEFNIYPAETADEFSSFIKDVLTELRERLKAKKPKWDLLVVPTATFDQKYFKRLPAVARALGCEPDFNVYSGGMNPPPATKEPFRTGAGHIHVGWTTGQIVTDTSHLFDCKQMVSQLDCVLYPMSLLWDSDEKRRTLYGKIGSYRPKHYGVEYRPLSNMWVADPDLHLWVFNATKGSAEMLDRDLPIFEDYMAKDVVERIQKGATPDRTYLLEYHDYLVEEYGIPSLPDAYIRSYQ